MNGSPCLRRGGELKLFLYTTIQAILNLIFSFFGNNHLFFVASSLPRSVQRHTIGQLLSKRMGSILYRAFNLTFAP
jgi:hypothetical protein